METPRIMIATPTPGMVRTAFMKAVIDTKDELAKAGIASEFHTREGSSVAHLRSVLATYFIDRKEFTHLLCFDSDMLWQANLASTMLKANKPVIAGAYTTKSLDPRKVDAALRAGLPFQEAMLYAMKWLVGPREGEKTIHVQDGLIEVGRIGFGAVLIRRDALETMIAKGAAQPQQDAEAPGGRFFNFFAPRTAGVTIGEDTDFCDRWVKDCGGELWVLMNAHILHVGDFAFGGSYGSFLQATAKMVAAQRRSMP